MAQVTSLILCLLIGLVASQIFDPITNFCRRFAHQTAVIDDRLYIDGGLVVYGGSIDSESVNYTNSYLLYANLSSVNGDSFPVQHDNLPKPSNVPSVQGAALWADQANKLFYLFGGEYNWTTPPPAQHTLWYFDAIYNTWNATSTDASADRVSPSSFGASAVDDNRGTAYYYGGWRSNASELGFNGNPAMQSSLITYDMNENKWRATVFIDDVPRAEGALFYIPASDKGMLVYFGGVQNTSNSSTPTGVPMDTIYLFDIGSQQTYSQKTSGGPPDLRRRFCGGVSWAKDRSSYNIYIYGGLPPYDTEGFGFNDVWILSIPSFTWTLWYNETINAHHSLSCNVVNEGQMLLMGGWFPNSTNNACDVPDIWGMHNLNLRMNNALDVPWYQYLPNLTYYSVPPNVTDVIGGSGTGGATLTTPQGGFDSDNLRTYLGRLAPTGSRTATRNISTSPPAPTEANQSQKSNVGAIAGGVVGGLAALIVLLVLILFCLRRRKRALASSPSPPEDKTQPPANMPDLPLDNQRAAFTPKRMSVDTSHGSPPPSWQPVAVNYIPQYQQRFAEDLPQQQYYPPPPLPQHYEQPSPTYEMPNVRSPPNAGDVGFGSGRTFGSRRTTSAHERISEE